MASPVKPGGYKRGFLQAGCFVLSHHSRGCGYTCLITCHACSIISLVSESQGTPKKTDTGVRSVSRTGCVAERRFGPGYAGYVRAHRNLSCKSDGISLPNREMSPVCAAPAGCTRRANRDQDHCRSRPGSLPVSMRVPPFVFSWIGDTRTVSRVSPDPNVACNARYIAPMMQVRPLNLRVTRWSQQVHHRKPHT